MRSLNKNLGISAEVLLKEPGAGFPNEMQELEWHRFPVVEMAKRCWIPKVEGKAIAAEVCALAKKLKIHPAIIAGRIRFEHNNYRLLSRHIGSGQIRKHFAESCSAWAA